MNKLNVLMIGPARSVKGGMTTVVDGYYSGKLDQKVNLKYIETVNDKNALSKICKMIKGFFQFIFSINKYDIVHIHMASRLSTFRKGIYIRIAKRKKKRVILHIHGAEYKIFYGKECNEKQRKKIRKSFELVDNIIVLSEEWKDYFKDLVDENKIIVLYNAVKVPENFDKDLNTKNILFLGRIGDRKGIFDLLDVIKKLIKQNDDIKLYVGGDGEVERLQEAIDKNQLTNNVEYIGWTNGEKKDKYLKEVSYYVLPSYNEGMPMSVLEGMAYKNVTISTNVGGIPKVIHNKENGIIINPGDKDELYKSFVELFSDKKLREKLSLNARKTIEEKFDVNKNVEDVIKIYKGDVI